MRDSAGRWLIVENVMLKYFKVMLNVFEFSNVKKIVELDWFMEIRFMNNPVNSFEEHNKTKLEPALTF